MADQSVEPEDRPDSHDAEYRYRRSADGAWLVVAEVEYDLTYLEVDVECDDAVPPVRDDGSVWQAGDQSPVGDQNCDRCRDGPDANTRVVLADRRSDVSVGGLVLFDHESEVHDVDRLCRPSGR